MSTRRISPMSLAFVMNPTENDRKANSTQSVVRSRSAPAASAASSNHVGLARDCSECSTADNGVVTLTPPPEPAGTVAMNIEATNVTAVAPASDATPLKNEPLSPPESVYAADATDNGEQGNSDDEKGGHSALHDDPMEVDTYNHEHCEFICAKKFDKDGNHEPCRTGQYTLNLSRKMVSDHFGRNKACTRCITNWVRYCRKHYQRSNYDTKKWQNEKCDLILEQLARIDEEYPGITYTVQLKKSERDRINQHYRQINQHGKESCLNFDEPTDENPVPIRILEQIDAVCTPHKTSMQCAGIVKGFKDFLQAGTITMVPEIEFLPEFDDRTLEKFAPPGTKVKPAPVPKIKAASKKRKPKAGGRRLTKKGGIKKPSAASKA